MKEPDITLVLCIWIILLIKTIWCLLRANGMANWSALTTGGHVLSWFKPQTYMNRSGRALSGVANFYNIPTERILVIHDDLDMRPGRIKFVHGGGSGGHKGIKSIVASLGANEFFRLKIGIGRPGIGGDTS